MNDPGLDDAIADEAVALDQSSGQQKDTTDADGRSPGSQYPQAARWWLASTAYPLMAVSLIQPNAFWLLFAFSWF